MITGLELAFALIPLVISATEHQKTLYRKARTIASRRAADERVEDFISELSAEVSLLRVTLRCLISGLTTLTEEQRRKLLNVDRTQWTQQEVIDAVRARLGDDANLAFTEMLNKLLKALEQVVSERSLQFIQPDITDSNALFKKLEGFRRAMESGHTIHKLGARFQFTTKEECRTTNLKKICKCNKILERLVHARPSGTMEWKKKSHLRRAQPPTNRSRRLSLDAHKRLARNWSCPCPTSHEVRLGLLKCLAIQERLDSTMDLDLLVSMTSTVDSKEIWLKSRVQIIPPKDEESSVIPIRGSNTNAPVVRFTTEAESRIHHSPNEQRHYIGAEPVCTLVQEAFKNKTNLDLVFDGQKLWHANTHSRHAILMHDKCGVSLKDLLQDSTSKLKLKQRRILAVILAHAILHYCESPWVADNWTKDHVNFVTDSQGPDLNNPYLVTQFEPLPTTGENTQANPYRHPSPSLLSLGILLLELHLLESIETRWDPEDTENGAEGPTTNWITAEKVLENFGDDIYEGYKSAIQACLKIDYVGVEDRLSLDDEVFRRLVYERVVVPLEDELRNGFNITPEELGVL